jgi:prepilin-type N-terminal cleavage/methylation domain-containing protein
VKRQRPAAAPPYLRRNRRVAAAAGRRGVSLVELLMVLAIGGLMLALLLPAIQAAREAARRSQCSSQLRQIGLALHLYHDSHRRLPPGCDQWRPWRGSPELRNLAWSAFILNHLEQAHLQARIDFSRPFDSPVNRPAAQTRLAIYNCPSLGDAAGPNGLGRTDYGGIYGQRITTRSATNNGVFIYNHAFALSDIRDGLSNTLAVAEDAGGPDNAWIDGNNIFEQAYGVNDPRALPFDNEIRSQHPGGALALFCCGRVLMLSDSIDLPTLAALITRHGGEIVDSL